MRKWRQVSIVTKFCIIIPIVLTIKIETNGKKLTSREINCQEIKRIMELKYEKLQTRQGYYHSAPHSVKTFLNSIFKLFFVEGISRKCMQYTSA